MNTEEKYQEIKSLLDKKIADDEKLKSGELDFLLEIAIRGDIAYRSKANMDFITHHALCSLWNKNTWDKINEDEIRYFVKEWAVFSLLYEFKQRDTHCTIFDYVTEVLKEYIDDEELVNKAVMYVKTTTPPVYLFADFFACDLRAKSWKSYPQETCKSVYSKLIHDLSQLSLYIAKKLIEEISKKEDLDYLKEISFVYLANINEKLKEENNELTNDEKAYLTNSVLTLIQGYDINKHTLIFEDDNVMDFIRINTLLEKYISYGKDVNLKLTRDDCYMLQKNYLNMINCDNLIYEIVSKNFKKLDNLRYEQMEFEVDNLIKKFEREKSLSWRDKETLEKKYEKIQDIFWHRQITGLSVIVQNKLYELEHIVIKRQ